MASRDSIGENACSLIGNTPMVFLQKVSQGCKAKIGTFFLLIFIFSCKIGIYESGLFGKRSNWFCND